MFWPAYVVIAEPNEKAGSMNYDHGHGEDRLCHTGRQTETDQTSGIEFIGNEILFFHIEEILHSGQLVKGQRCRDKLGDDRSPGNTRDTHFEICHKDKVEDDIEEGCHQQINQSGNRIAKTSQHAAEDIVKSASGHADEDDDQILMTPVNDCLRCIQKL